MRSALRLFFAAFLVIFIAFHSVIPAFAQTQENTQPQTTTSYTYPPTAPDVPHDLNTLTQGILFSVLSTATCVTSGVNLVTPSKPCMSVNSQTGVLEYASSNGGLVGLSSKLITLTMNIPIHTSLYTQYLSNNFHGLGEKTYAATTQGVGYAGLQPLLNLWVGFRNLAYLFLVIAFIVIGFAIMLRLKIDPRTVMTIQNQIPKIIVGIILVTFSFAIAAVLIDLMYVVTYLIINFVATIAGDADLLSKNPIGQNPLGLAFDMFTGGIFGVATGVAQTVQQVAGQMISDIPILGGLFLVLGVLSLLPYGSFLCLLPSIPFVPGSGASCQSYSLGAPLIGAIAGLVVIIAVIIALWKLWLSLIKAYLLILFNTTLGPLMILGGVIPGVKLGFGSWLRGLIANLAIFPAVITVFVLGREFALAFGGFTIFPDPNKAQYFIPPGIGNLGNTGGLAGVIAFAVLMLLPAIPDAVTKALKAESPLSNAVGQGLATGIAFPIRGAKSVGHQLFRMPDPLRHQSAGVGLRAMLGDNPKGWRWKYFLKSQGMYDKGITDLIKPQNTVGMENKPQHGG
jgi:hypothetical protein